jgi:hypothetical protein
MNGFPRLVLASWLFLIFSFCVYGVFMTYGLPGESFCCSMYSALTVFSGVCIFQVLEPSWERAR